MALDGQGNINVSLFSTIATAQSATVHHSIGHSVYVSSIIMDIYKKNVNKQLTLK